MEKLKARSFRWSSYHSVWASQIQMKNSMNVHFLKLKTNGRLKLFRTHSTSKRYNDVQIQIIKDENAKWFNKILFVVKKTSKHLFHSSSSKLQPILVNFNTKIQLLILYYVSLSLICSRVSILYTTILYTHIKIQSSFRLRAVV